MFSYFSVSEEFGLFFFLPGLVEDVLKEFAAKKCVKLGKLLERSGGVGVESKEKESTTSRGPSSKRDLASADNCLSTKVFSPA